MIRERVKTLRAGIGTLLAVGAAICIVTIMPAAAQNAALPLAGILGPDSKIAFHGDREGRDSPDEIYVMSADGSGERRVTPTTDACNAINPRWSEWPSNRLPLLHRAGIFRDLSDRRGRDGDDPAHEHDAGGLGRCLRNLVPKRE